VHPGIGGDPNPHDEPWEFGTRALNADSATPLSARTSSAAKKQTHTGARPHSDDSSPAGSGESADGPEAAAAVGGPTQRQPRGIGSGGSGKGALATEEEADGEVEAAEMSALLWASA